MVELAGGSIAAIVFCPHDPKDKCSCRKPSPKMIIDICNRFNADDISKIMMIGDSLKDLEAINNAGGIPILVKTGNGKKTLNSDKLPAGTMIFENLLEASEYIVSKPYEELNEDK